jgi:hypothetical protein
MFRETKPRLDIPLHTTWIHTIFGSILLTPKSPLAFLIHRPLKLVVLFWIMSMPLSA